jgi:hypothetical protein
VGQAISDQLMTEYGVPQGEIISPLIFIIYKLGYPALLGSLSLFVSLFLCLSLSIYLSLFISFSLLLSLYLSLFISISLSLSPFLSLFLSLFLFLYSLYLSLFVSLSIQVSTDNRLLTAEGAAHFWLDKDFYYIDMGRP